MKIKKKFLFKQIVLVLFVVFIPFLVLSFINYNINYKEAILTAERELRSYTQLVISDYKGRIKNIDEIANIIYKTYVDYGRVDKEKILEYSLAINSYYIVGKTNLNEGLNFKKEGEILKIFYVKQLKEDEFLILDIKNSFIFKEIEGFLHESREGVFGKIYGALYFGKTPLYWSEGGDKPRNLDDTDFLNRIVYVKIPLHNENITFLIFYPNSQINSKVLTAILFRTIAFFILASSLAMLFVFISYKNLERRFKKITEISKAIAEGNILKDIRITPEKDEFGVIEEGLNKSLKVINREILMRERIINDKTKELNTYIEGIELALNIFLRGIRAKTYEELFNTINSVLKSKVREYDFGVWYVWKEDEDLFYLQSAFGIEKKELVDKVEKKLIDEIIEIEDTGTPKELIDLFKDKFVKQDKIKINDLKLVKSVSLETVDQEIKPILFGVLGSREGTFEILTKKITFLLSNIIKLLFVEIDQSTRLKETIKKLEEANMAKINFINTISHDLRTPLNAILGFTQMLIMGVYGNLSDKQREALYKIQTSGRYLMDLIDELLESARLEAKRRKPVLGVIDQEVLIKNIKDTFLPMAQEKGLEFRLDVNINTNEIYSDYNALNRIITNLLENAVKYTDSGYVEFKYIEDGERILIEVKDTGKGIPKDKINEIFKPFETTMLKRGVGLGLSITKHLVDLLGGNISVESELDKGSVFRVVIPLKRFPALKKTKEGFKENSVLIIENNLEDIELIKDIFERRGKIIYIARTGREAYSILNKFVPEIIFIDIVLPDYSGLEIIKEIRKRKEFQKTSIFVYSALEKRKIIGISRYFEKGKIDFCTLAEKVFESLKKGVIKCGVFYDQEIKETVRNILKGDRKLEIKFMLPLKDLKNVEEWKDEIIKVIRKTEVPFVMIFVSEKHKEVPFNLDLLRAVFEYEKMMGVGHVVIYLKGNAIIGTDILIERSEQKTISNEIIRQLENLVE